MPQPPPQKPGRFRGAKLRQDGGVFVLVVSGEQHDLEDDFGGARVVIGVRRAGLALPDG
jgi:hypothetical protein